MDIPSQGLGATRFRRAMSCFATGVVVLSTVCDDRDYVMTANSFTSVSLDPMLVLICVTRGSRFGVAVNRSGLWAASVLPAHYGPTAKWFATKGRSDPLETVHYTRGPLSGAALLDEALATFECRNQSVVHAGDHDIVIADVLAAWSDDSEQAPLVFYRGRLE